MNLNDLTSDLARLADQDKAVILQRFFKTGSGQYGEGDIFLGITVPAQREVAKKYTDLTLVELQKLLASKVHEHRLTALIILVTKYQRALRKTQGKPRETERKKIVDFYLKNSKYINNWDLVDSSAEYIVGDYLMDRGKSILHKLARSKNLWERRIAVVATFAFIKNRRFGETFKIAENLLGDNHDLIHKAVGWMLREVGKRDQNALENFLQKHYPSMPRTMLRYAIERFDESKKKFYMVK